MNNRILVVDDDVNICDMLKQYLEEEKFSVSVAYNGDDALEMNRALDPALILLDIMMPGRNGKDVCNEIRKYSRVPIIMITAKSNVVDKVVCLELGADDYIVKPFDMSELFARIKSVLRRCSAEEQVTDEDVIRYDNIEISKHMYELKLRGRTVDVPPEELELLFFLALNKNQVFTRDQLLERVWGFDYMGDSRTIDVHIKRLREKLAGVSDKWRLKTVWGVGYKFEVD
ncbi:MAG: response regulator transcription factor [Clostridia bacterium]|nr:response regulator transcription factor [Clostridia bacterium]